MGRSAAEIKLPGSWVHLKGFALLSSVLAVKAAHCQGPSVFPLTFLGWSLQVALLHPLVAVAKSDVPSGCFGKTDVNSGQLFGWELIMTFVLVMTVYAVAGEPAVR